MNNESFLVFGAGSWGTALSIQLYKAGNKVFLTSFDETNLSKIKTEKDQLHFEVFKYYHFPILHLSKKEMLAKAYENGWKEIIDLTWFCHKPQNNKPCGKCNPCRTAVSEGLGNKIPFFNRFVYDAKTVLGVYALKKMLRKGK